MQIQIENGYVSSYALIGTLVGGVEIPDPPDVEHFEANYQAYQMQDGALVFDEKQKQRNERKALCDELRQQRETECFSVINRGQLWYDRLTEAQESELAAWYESWLHVTETLTVPQRPSWL